MFPWGLIVVGSGLALASVHKVPGASHFGDALARHAHKRTVSLFTDTTEFAQRVLTIAKNPKVSLPLAVGAVFVGVVPLVGELVLTPWANLAYVIHGLSAAPAALLAAPLGVHHFRALKRNRERQLGSKVDITTLQGPYTLREHVAAEASDLSVAAGISQRVAVKVAHGGARMGKRGLHGVGKAGKFLVFPITLGARGMGLITKQVHPTAIKLRAQLKADNERLQQEIVAKDAELNTALRKTVESLEAELATHSRTRRFKAPDVEVAGPQAQEAPAPVVKLGQRKTSEKGDKSLKL
jgi:hypothetical protein